MDLVVEPAGCSEDLFWMVKCFGRLAPHRLRRAVSSQIVLSRPGIIPRDLRWVFTHPRGVNHIADTRHFGSNLWRVTLSYSLWLRIIRKSKKCLSKRWILCLSVRGVNPSDNEVNSQQFRAHFRKAERKTDYATIATFWPEVSVCLSLTGLLLVQSKSQWIPDYQSKRWLNYRTYSYQVISGDQP